MPRKEANLDYICGHMWESQLGCPAPAPQLKHVIYLYTLCIGELCDEWDCGGTCPFHSRTAGGSSLQPQSDSKAVMGRKVQTLAGTQGEGLWIRGLRSIRKAVTQDVSVTEGFWL